MSKCEYFFGEFKNSRSSGDAVGCGVLPPRPFRSAQPLIASLSLRVAPASKCTPPVPYPTHFVRSILHFSVVFPVGAYNAGSPPSNPSWPPARRTLQGIRFRNIAVLIDEREPENYIEHEGPVPRLYRQAGIVCAQSII